MARKGTGFLAANDVQAMVSDEEEEEEHTLSSLKATLKFLMSVLSYIIIMLYTVHNKHITYIYMFNM